MRTITIRALPDELYDLLRRRAGEERRSLNDEALVALESEVPRAMDLETWLARNRRMHERYRIRPITLEEIDRFKREGRP